MFTLIKVTFYAKPKEEDFNMLREIGATTFTHSAVCLANLAHIIRMLYPDLCAKYLYTFDVE